METKEQPFTVRGILNRAKGLMAPPETMTQKYARQDADRAAKTPPVSTPEAAEKPDVIDTIKARNKLMQGLADGGIVKQLRYLSGMPNEERAMEKSRPAPTMNNQTPVESKPITSKLTVDDLGRGLGFENVRRHKAKMEFQGLKDGGEVRAGIIRGPGTGTSDSIKGKMPVGSFVMPKDSTDVMVSNGETHFTPEMVQSIGAAALMATKGLTHTPVAEQSAAKFANGGVVEDKAVFGFYPQLTGNRLTTHDTENKLKAGYTSGGAPAVTQTSIPSGNSTAGAGRGFVNPSVEQAAPQAPQATPGVSPTGGIARPAQPTLAATPAVAALAAPTNNRVVKDGNSYSGTNISGDVSFVDPKGKALTSSVSPQNYPAAQALATSTAAPTAPAIEQGGVNYGDGSGRPGLGFSANLARKNAETGASSIFNTASRQSARDQLKAMDTQELAGANNQSTQAIAKLSADTSLANTRIGADTQRVGYGIQSQNNLANQQNAAARLGIDRTTANLQNQQTTQQIGASKQMQDLQTRLLTAKPDERAAIEDNLRALQGKYEKTVPEDYAAFTDTDANGVKTNHIFNKRTGQIVQQQAKKQAAPPQAGSIVDGYRFKGGNPSDQNNWEKK